MARAVAAPERRPAKAAKRWLAEILTAVERGELGGARRVAALELPFPEPLGGAASDIRAAIAGGDDAERLRLVVAVADGAIEGWEELLDDELRSTAHRIAAWQHLMLHGDLASAGAHVKQAISLQPYDARAYVERRLALNRLDGLGDAAARDAQKAIELAPSSALGYGGAGRLLEAAARRPGRPRLRRGAEPDAGLGRGRPARRGADQRPDDHLLLRARAAVLSVHRRRAARAARLRRRRRRARPGPSLPRGQGACGARRRRSPSRPSPRAEVAER